MNTGGWIMVILSWVVIISLVLFCYWRFFKLRRINIKAPLEINTEAD